MIVQHFTSISSGDTSLVGAARKEVRCGKAWTSVASGITLASHHASEKAHSAACVSPLPFELCGLQNECTQKQTKVLQLPTLSGGGAPRVCSQFTCVPSSPIRLQS